jgi:SAM-dependent methyltransferase
LERHRFLSLLLGTLSPYLDDVGTLVEIAPSPQSTRQLDRVPARRRIGLDIGYDNRTVHALASLTRLPLPPASVDLLVCYHVLEHIPDDRTAMAEIARVLSARGIALIQVPIRRGVPTDEDPSAGPEERTSRFGQHDHVRFYGDDFEARLAHAGLEVHRATPPGLLGHGATERFGLMAHEIVWIVRRGDSAPVPVDAATHETGMTLALDALVEENRKLRAQLRRARRRVAAVDQPARPQQRSRPWPLVGWRHG